MDNYNINNHDFSFLTIFMNAHIIIQSIVVVLLIMSVLSWAIIIEKITIISFETIRLKSFIKKFQKKKEFQEKYTYSKDSTNIGALLFSQMYHEIQISQQIKNSQTLLFRIQNASGSIIDSKLNKMDDRLQTLASIGSVAPFIGLLGTVWGIMYSFENIAKMKNSNLAIVAPGIAEALFVTALGLFVAIPALYMYNSIVKSLSNYEIRVHNFNDNLINSIVSQYEYSIGQKKVTKQ